MCVQFIPAAGLLDYVLLLSTCLHQFLHLKYSLKKPYAICRRHVVRGQFFFVAGLIGTLWDYDSRKYVNDAFIL